MWNFYCENSPVDASLCKINHEELRKPGHVYKALDSGAHSRIWVSLPLNHMPTAV
jgi:hypothetical protein